MAALDTIRWTMRGAFGRLTMVLGLALGLAITSAAIAPKAHADSFSLGFNFGDADIGYGATFGDDDYEYRPRHRRAVPRYVYPDQDGPRYYTARRRHTDTVCNLVPVQVWDGYGYVIEDVQRCRRVSRW